MVYPDLRGANCRWSKAGFLCEGEPEARAEPNSKKPRHG